MVLFSFICFCWFTTTSWHNVRVTTIRATEPTCATGSAEVSACAYVLPRCSGSPLHSLITRPLSPHPTRPRLYSANSPKTQAGACPQANKIPTGPTGKRGPPQKVDQFFRNFSGWTEPIHWVLDRNFRKILVEWIAPDVYHTPTSSKLV